MVPALVCLVVLAQPTPAWQLSVRPEAGEVLAWDSTSTPIHYASADSSMQMPVVGATAEARPWRALVASADALFGTGATLDTPQVNPTRTGVGYRRLGLGVGWRFGFTGLEPLHAVVAMVGFGQERWSADRQFMPGADHRQVTPSFSRNEPWLRATVEGALAGGRLAVRAAVTAVPWAYMSNDWATDGSKQYAWGLDVGARAEWSLGTLLGSFGDVGAGVAVDGGFRRVNWSGTGTRTNSQGTPVQDVSERLARMTLAAFVSVAIAGGSEPAAKVPVASERAQPAMAQSAGSARSPAPAREK